MANSPTVPAMSGRIPCFVISRRFVCKPTPAKVSRNAQRERLAMSAIWGFEKPDRCQQGNQKETQHELGELLPDEGCLVPHAWSLRFLGPIPRIAQDHETDGSVARGLCEYGEFSGGIGIERAGGGRSRGRQLCWTPSARIRWPTRSKIPGINCRDFWGSASSFLC